MKRIFLPPLTGVRGLAALWVLSFHADAFVPITVPFFQMGYVGVDVFFVLSGFILGHVHLDDFVDISIRGIRRFLALRLSRIYPVHLAMLAVATLFAIVLFVEGVPVLSKPRFYPPLFAANILLVHAWGWVANGSFNIVSWSISAEWLAYLAFPVLALAGNRMSGRSAMAIAIIAIVGEMAVLSWVGFYGRSAMVARVSGEFVCGLCCYILFRKQTFSHLRWGLLTDLAFVAFLVAVWQGSFNGALPLIPVLILGLAYGGGAFAWLATRPVALYLGNVSYSLYMVHLMTIEIVFAPLTYSRFTRLGLWPRTGVMLIALAGIALATLAMHRFVEVPARVWLRNRIERRALGRPALERT